MVRQCLLCRKLDYLHPDVSFHRFPSNPERRKIWCSLLGFEEGKILPKCVDICSGHFNANDFEYKPSGIKYLKKDAKPISRASTPPSSVAESDNESNTSILQDSQENKIFPVSSERRSIWVKHLGFSQEQTIPKAARICSNHFNEDDFEYRKSGAKFLKQNASPISVLHSEIIIKQEELESPSELKNEQISPVESEVEDELSENDSMVSSALPLIKTESDSTLTASETEDYILENMREKADVSELVGPSSGYKGVLSLLISPSKKDPVLVYTSRSNRSNKRKLFAGDLSSDDFSSPEESKRHFKLLKTTICDQRKKIKCLQQNVRRLRGRITSMECQIQLLNQKLQDAGL